MSTPPLPEPLPPDARERVAEALTRHFANDQLTEAELEARLQRAYAATTGRELDAIVADLPALPMDALPARPGETTDIVALFSGQERTLEGVVPRDLDLRARLGYVELDLTRATFAPGVTTIDVRAFMGYVQIRFPPGVRVECAGRALFGYFSLKGSGKTDAGEPDDAQHIVRITGRAVFGFAEAYVSSGQTGAL